MTTTNETWMPEARQMAAQCWCDPETEKTVMDPPLAEAFARRIAAWMETGAFHARNEEYWRGRAHAAEKDAERYQFTRDNWFQYFEPTRSWKLSTATGKTVHEGSAETYEAAVDDAISKSGYSASA